MTKNTAIEALIFDWDGTLADSTAHIICSVQEAFAAAKLPIPNRDSVAHIIGLSLNEAMEYLLPDLNAATKNQLIDGYRRRYFGAEHPTMLFDGVYQWLERWQQRYAFMGIATGKSRRGLERALDETATRTFFSATRTADDCASKPAPDMVLSLCDAWGLVPEQVLMIGDTTHDLMAAQTAGALAVGVTTGAHRREQLLSVKPQGVFNSLSEVAAYLNCLA